MAENENTRPDYVEDEYLVYLDELRISGVTNMYGAASYLINEFGLDKKVASAVLTYWMKTFGKDNR